MGTARIYRSRLLSATNTARIYKSNLSVGGGVGNTARIYKSTLLVSGAVSAGADQLDVEPYRLVTLTGVDTGLSGAVRLWEQIAGTPVTLITIDPKTRTFEAPGTVNGDTLTFRYSIDGASFDTVDVVVQRATEFKATAAGWVPMKMQRV